MSEDQAFTEHRRTYQGFVKGSVISMVVIVVVLVLMAIFLL